MTKKTRTILFLGCLLIFIFFAPTAILYSQGYRFNFNLEDGKKLITRTGGVFLKVQPRQAEVYLNGKLKDKTDFLFGSLLIENLLPEKYKIEVKKPNYHSWQKNLEVKEKEVTEAKNIVLFPENLEFTTLTEGILAFWPSPNQNIIILEEEDESGWVLSSYDTEKELKNQLMKQADLALKNADLADLEFSEETGEVILKIQIAEEIRYFSFDPSDNPIKITEIKKPEEKKYIFFDYTFKEENDVLSVSNPDSKEFEELFDSLKGFKPSPDSDKIVYFSNYEIWIMFLQGYDRVLQKQAGDKMFLIRLSENIGDVFWLNPKYLLFNAGGNIKIMEIDNRDRLNIVDITQIKNPELFWNKQEKRIYILSENKLSRSLPLLP
ncbi:MAG: hypothetical protein ABH831_02610 [Candidatus Nealsonbacteria bacterium]